MKPWNKKDETGSIQLQLYEVFLTARMKQNFNCSLSGFFFFFFAALFTDKKHNVPFFSFGEL